MRRERRIDFSDISQSSAAQLRAMRRVGRPPLGAAGVRRMRHQGRLVRNHAAAAGWPFPMLPGRHASPEAKKAWKRLYRRLLWILDNRAALAANARPGARFARLRHAAKQRGLEVTLTFDDYRRLMEDARCAYCSAAPAATGHGVDRKDSKRGYTLDNVVTACDPCNRIKGDLLTFDQMKVIGRIIRRWRREGTWADPTRADGRKTGGRPLAGDLRVEIEEWNRRLRSGSTLALESATAGPEKPT